MRLDRSFYQRSDVIQVARELLGKTLVSRKNGQLTSGVIVETEAYKAPEDKGSHAYNNRRTKRTEVMFSKGGLTYIYLCYGLHHLFNVVTGLEGEAHAVLIRAIEPLSGRSMMAERRSMSLKSYSLTNGPGKLTQALGVEISDNGLSLIDPDALCFIESRSDQLDDFQIQAGPRVGIANAGLWAHQPWRFRIRDNPWTSKPDQVIYDKVN